MLEHSSPTKKERSSQTNKEKITAFDRRHLTINGVNLNSQGMATQPIHLIQSYIQFNGTNNSIIIIVKHIAQ